VVENILIAAEDYLQQGKYRGEGNIIWVNLPKLLSQSGFKR
jgi:hypothetical protein